MNSKIFFSLLFFAFHGMYASLQTDLEHLNTTLQALQQSLPVPVPKKIISQQWSLNIPLWALVSTTIGKEKAAELNIPNYLTLAILEIPTSHSEDQQTMRNIRDALVNLANKPDSIKLNFGIEGEKQNGKVIQSVVAKNIQYLDKNQRPINKVLFIAELEKNNILKDYIKRDQQQNILIEKVPFKTGFAKPHEAASYIRQIPEILKEPLSISNLYLISEKDEQYLIQ